MAMAQKRERIVPRLIEEEIRDSFLDYSMSVIVQRALPDVRDGLKPVHRRILFAMHELGLMPDRGYKKSATVVGDVLGKYHPHGDSAVYDALVRMVQDFSLRYPLVDGQGNFGSIDGDSAAAYRYTEARLEAVSREILRDIEKETVDWAPNFDGRLDEPTVLPTVLPNLLVNGSSGIAVGMSTNVPPHNLTEVASAIRVLVNDPECTVEDLKREIPGPDFPTGGFIVGRDGIDSMYETGRGRVVMRGRVIRESLRGGKQNLVVVELPYTVSKSRLIRQIADLSRKGSIPDVADLRDESDRDGIRLVVELKRGADAGAILRTLYRKTALQATFGAILLALHRGQPKEFDLKGLLSAYRDHRLDVIVRRARHDLEKAEADRHVTQGLLVALDNIDEVIAVIRSSRDRPEASTRLQDTFGLSEVQADAILNMRLAKLTSLEHDQLRVRLRELEEIIADLRDILGSEDRRLDVLLEELGALVEQFGDERRTEILTDEEESEQAIEGTVADEDVVVTVSHEGFVKRMPVHLYRRRVNSGKALAGMDKYEEDFLERIFVARTQGYVLCFTEGGHCHFLNVLDIPESGRASRGQSVYGLVGSDRSDRIVALVPVDDFDADRVVVFVSDGGLVKRTHISEFSNPRAGGIIAAGVKGGERIADAVLSDGNAEVILMTSGGRAIRFAENEVSVMGRTARGVKGVDLKGGQTVVGVVLVRREAGILTVTDRAFGKRTPIGDFPRQKRGGQGTMALPSSGDAGSLVCGLEVQPGDAVMVVTAGGLVTRLEADDIPEQGRRTAGSKLFKLAAGDRIVEVTRAPGERSQRAETGTNGMNGSGGTNGAARSNGAGPSESDGETATPLPTGEGEDGGLGDERQMDLLGDD
jgi:DNA gyrase subunit A